MHTLTFLTVQEKQAFDRLSADLREGWDVAPSKGESTESLAQEELRVHLVRLHDPVLQRFLKDADACEDERQLSALFATVDLKKVHQDDLLELVFALGPYRLSPIILHLLRHAKTDQDLFGVASLMFFREELFAASSPS